MFPLHPQDELAIMVEVCSSSVHPGVDRSMARRMVSSQSEADANLSTTIVTANPGRMTRCEEVEVILDWLDSINGKWVSATAALIARIVMSGTMLVESRGKRKSDCPLVSLHHIW